MKLKRIPMHRAKSMAMGMNLGWITTWAHYWPFANVLYNVGEWASLPANTGTFTQVQGRITSTVSTDRYRTVMNDDGGSNSGWAPGQVFRVLNPNGNKIAFGTFTDTPTVLSYKDWTTQTDFTFTWPGAVGATCMYVEGNLVGDVQVLFAEDYTSWTSGCIWRPEYLTYLQNMGIKVFRAMDWIHASGNVETDWTDRNLPTGVTLFNDHINDTAVPWEFIIDLANRVGIDPWVNIPYRATTAYATAMANLFNNGLGNGGGPASMGKNGLAAGRRLHMELGNEIWNHGSAWAGGTDWIENLTYTRFTATANPATDVFTKVGHGMTSGEQVLGWITPASFANGGVESDASNPDSWIISRGGSSYVEVIDANTFRLHQTSAAGPLITIPNGWVDFIYSRLNEAGKSPNIHVNYGTKSLQMWDTMDPIMGASRIFHICAAQAADANGSNTRLGVTGMRTRTDGLAIAPYFDGDWFGTTWELSTTVARPRTWSNRSGAGTPTVVHAALYAAGSTPTDAEVIAGTGTGFVAKTTFNAVTADGQPFTEGPDITGLVAGTTYKSIVMYITTNTPLYRWRDELNITPSANRDTTSTTSIAISNGSKTITIGTGKAFVVGDDVIVRSATTPTNWMSGYVTAYNSGTGVLTINAQSSSGTATYANWIVHGGSFVASSFTQMMLRNDIDTIEGGVNNGAVTQLVLDHQVSAGSIPVICYEGGLHFHESAPYQVKDWLKSYQEAPEFAQAIQLNVHQIASLGVPLFCYYGDILGTSFSIADFIEDQTDLRFQKISSFKGHVRKTPRVVIPDVDAGTIPTVPTFPYQVYSFGNPSLTYRILGGNDVPIFQMQADQLRMLTDTGVDWTSPIVRNVYVMADNGLTGDITKLSISLGDAWYSTSASWAWDTKRDTDPLQINPMVGGTISLNGAVPQAVIRDDMWDPNGASDYVSPTGLTGGTALTTTKPIFMAVVADRFNEVGSFITFLQFGSFPLLLFYQETFASNKASFRIASSTPSLDTTWSIPWGSGKYVFWFFLDAPNGKIFYGRNSLESNAVGGDPLPVQGVPASFSATVWYKPTHGLIGSNQVVNKAGMTLADAKALVKKMQAYHNLEAMTVGGNVGGIASYRPPEFINLMYQQGPWEQISGTGAWTQDHGNVTATNQNDIFHSHLSDFVTTIPFGTYRVLNPDGNKIAFGAFHSTSYTGGFTTATDFTFNYDGSLGALFMQVQGSLTNNLGNIVVLMPGTYAQWQTGNVWNPAMLTWLAGMKLRSMRFMDWNNTGANLEVEWADRTTMNHMAFSSPYTAGLSIAVPYELMIDLCNRLNMDLWISLPVRTSVDYVTQLATLVKNTLSPGLKMYLELGNEVWNFQSAYSDGMAWLTYLHHTRYTATANFAAGTFTLANHGLTNGETLVGFLSANNIRTSSAVDYRTTIGVSLTAEVIDANTFRLRDNTQGGQIVAPAAAQVDYVYIRQSEAGKPVDMNAHYGEISMRNWDAVDAVLGVNNYVHVCGSQAANPSLTASRMAVTNMATRTDAIAIAPYMYAPWFGTDCELGATSIIPKLWVSVNTTVHIAVYPAASTPTTAAVLAGTGIVAGTAKQTLAYTYPGAAQWTTATTLSGLVDGTAYKVYFVVETVSNGATYYWTVVHSITPGVAKTGTSTTSLSIGQGVKTLTTQTGKSLSAGQNVILKRTSDPTLTWMTGTVTTYNSGTGALTLFINSTSGSGTYTDWTLAVESFVFDSNANMQERHQMSALDGGSLVQQHTAVSGGNDIIAYEGGPHTHEAAPYEVVQWRNSYFRSANFGSTIKYYMHRMAAAGMKQFSYFTTDVEPVTLNGIWSVAYDYTDVTDVRYLALAALNGGVNKLADVNIIDVLAPDITADPGTYPATVYTFSDATLTYTILGGNEKGNFAIVGNVLQLINSTGVNWAIPAIFNLKVSVRSNYMEKLIQVSFALGNGWYAADAIFALNMATQASTASLTPDVGGVMTPAGAQGTLSGGMLSTTGASTYLAVNGMTSLPVFTKPLFIAFVSDKNNASTFGQTFQIGNSSFITTYTAGGTTFTFRAYGNGQDFNVDIPNWASGSKHVFWVLYDQPNNKLYYGRDQVEANAAGGTAWTSWPTSGFEGAHVRLFADDVDKKGSLQVVNRVGLTLAQAKALVQKMQTVHSIP